MKIEGSLKSVGSAPPSESRTRPMEGKGAPTAGSGEKVELSNISASLSKADAAIASTPEIDRARVDEIKQAISEGRFTIDAGRIADKLIGSVRQILEAQPGQS